jgi:hypothetical protein
LGASNLVQEVNAVKCDICNREFANSEEVKAHKEEAHPMGDGEEKREVVESETPEPSEQRNR